MVLLILIVIVWTPYAVPKLLQLLSVQDSSTPSSTPPRQARAEPPAGTHTFGQDVPAWSALDERQLIRLLTSSAPRTSND